MKKNIEKNNTDAWAMVLEKSFTRNRLTIIYAYMQAIGMVNDHLESCPLRR
jgi:3-methyladenine DNA glycosylase Tag